MSRSYPAVLIATALIGAVPCGTCRRSVAGPGRSGGGRGPDHRLRLIHGDPGRRRCRRCARRQRGHREPLLWIRRPASVGRDRVSSDSSITSVGGWTYVAPADATQPGAGGTEVLTLVTRATGHATVTARYSQPWDGGQKGAWTLTLDVVVRDAVPVAIDCSAFDNDTAATAAVDAQAGSAVVLTVCSNASTRVHLDGGFFVGFLRRGAWRVGLRGTRGAHARRGWVPGAHHRGGRGRHGRDLCELRPPLGGWREGRLDARAHHRRAVACRARHLRAGRRTTSW